MSLWKEYFHWSVLLRWDVLGWIIGAFLALAGLVLFFDQYAAANACFMLTTIFIFAKITQLAVASHSSTVDRLLFTFVCFGILGIGIVETIRGVNRSAESRREPKSESAKDESIPNDVKTNQSTPLTLNETTEISPKPAAPPIPQRAPAQVEGMSSPSPIDGLAQLGWSVQPGATDIQFEVAYKQIPDMEKSARYFKTLNKPFRLHFQGVKGLTGLHILADIGECKKIEINAGEFSDISELRGFSRLTSLGISQTPLNALLTVDSSPLSSLTSLRELNLYSTRIMDLVTCPPKTSPTVS